MRWIGLLAGLIIGLFCAAMPASAAEELPLKWEQDWTPVASGIEFALARAGRGCASGSAMIAIVRADPAKAIFDTRHFRAEKLEEGLTAGDWLKRTKSAAVINAGQYDEELNHLGYLVHLGRDLSKGRHPSFKALFVAEPRKSRKSAARPQTVKSASKPKAAPAPVPKPFARIIDLKEEAFDPRRGGYLTVLQSFMLLDKHGEKRVRQSGKIAERTIVAEDDQGRILAFTTEGQYTLWDFADLLTASGLGIVQAMSLDGGHAAQMNVLGGGVAYDADAARSFGAFSPRLPAVLTIRPR